MRNGSGLFCKASFFVSVLFVGVGLFSFLEQNAAAAEGDPPIAWTNWNGTGKWNDAGNWNLLRVPVAGDEVLFNNTSQADCLAEVNTVPQDLKSLTLASNFIGTLLFEVDFAEGSSQELTVTGDVVIQGGSLVVRGKQVDDTTGIGVTLKAANVTISGNGVLHSDEGGFAADAGVGKGPGAATGLLYGASHGGRGEDNTVNLPYGSPTAPVTLGSSGSDSRSDSTKTQINGGGAIKIEATATVTIDGKIRCNAGDRGRHNAGSGGSIYITCADFAGSGFLQARGGNVNTVVHSPGGGGRISVRWTGSTTFDGAYDVSGGKMGTFFGQPGTLSLPDGTDLTVKSSYKVGLAPGSHTLGNITVESGAELFCHSTFDPAGTPNWDQPGDQTGCVLNVTSLTVEVDGVVSADGGGFAPSKGPGGDATGGSHGGRGAGDDAAYGNPLAPTLLGSGGKARDGWGRGSTFEDNPRPGGGAIKINTSGSVVINGSLRSNGRLDAEPAGGAGGSVWVICDALSGSGVIEAKGGAGDAGGGRVALDFTSTTFAGAVNAAGTGSGEDGSVVPGSLNVLDHGTLATNAFLNAGPFTDREFLNFQLKPSGNQDADAFESFSVSKLVFDLDLLSGVVTNDITNVRVFTDSNDDGSSVSEAALVSSSVVVSVNGASGTITVLFGAGSLNLNGAAGSRNFILVADVANVAGGDGFRVALNGTDSKVTGSGVTFGKLASTTNQTRYAALSGSTSGVLHQVADAAIDHYAVSATTPQIETIGWTETITAETAGNVTVDTLILVSLTTVSSAKFYTDATFTTETTTAVLNNGTATIYVKDDTAEAVMLTAADGSGPTGTSTSITVGAWPVDHYDVTNTTPQTAGIGWTETITAKDGSGVTLLLAASVPLTSSGAAKFYSDATYTTEVTSVTLNAGTGIATIFVRDETAETMTLTGTDAFSKTGISGNIVVNPAGLDHYLVTGTSPQVKGTGWTETVTAVDAFDNTVAVNSNVNLSQSGNATFHTDGTFAGTTATATLTNGVATLFVKDDTEETVTLTATDGSSKTGTSPEIDVRWTLQARIDAASPGDTIVVALGTYNESLVIDKKLTLTSTTPTSGSKPIIDGGGAAKVIEITASEVTIDGFEIRNAQGDVVYANGTSTITDIIVRNCVVHSATNEGIVLGDITNGTVENCMVFGVAHNGVNMGGITNGLVKNCDIGNGCQSASAGIVIQWSNSVTVEGCYIHDINGAENGLLINKNYSGTYTVFNNVFADNVFLDEVNWQPQGGSVINLYKPILSGETGTVVINHNTMVNNSGSSPSGTTGHAIAWGWNINEAPTETITVKNNLMNNNSGSAFESGEVFGSLPLLGTRSASVDYCLHTEAITLHDDGVPSLTTVGGNNTTTSPTYASGGFSKFRYRLDSASAGYQDGDDSKDMGALLDVNTAPQILSPLTANATIGKPFLYILTGAGVPNPTFSISGALPDGLSFSVDRITGTPTVGGTFNIQLTATNAVNPDDVETLVLSVTLPPEITSTLTDTVLLNQSYTYTVTAAGSPAPTLNATDLPAGLSFSGSTITGTPTASGIFNIALSAVNSVGSDSEILVLTVSELPLITSSLSAVANANQAFSYTITATGFPAPTFGASGLPGGLSISGDKISGTPTTAGQFSVTLTATNAGGTDTQTLSLRVEGAPVVGSGIAATPNPARVGDTVSFSVSASDPNGDTLTYSWNFGDGNSGSGTNPTHVYATSGSFTATVTITDGNGGSVSDSLTVTMTDPVALDVVKAMVRLKFTGPGRDMVRLDVILPIPAGFDPEGQTLALDFGGLQKTWTLDRKGKSKDGTSLCRMKIKRKKKVVIAQNSKVRIIMKKGDFTGFMTDEGMLDETIKNKSIEVVLKLTFNGVTYGTGMTTSGANPLFLFYKAREGKAGIAKTARR